VGSAILSGREQRVKIDDKASAWTEVRAGVIQGSVLGPTLFLLFIADINEHITDLVELIKYADDILIYNIFKDLSDNKIQRAFEAIAEWAKNNKMKLNEAKTQQMIVNSKQQPSVSVVLNSQHLKETTDYKYLGLHLNNRMSCENHWVTLSRKLCSNFFLNK
jgi:ribonuclease P/MRP protein subunit RPP40